MIGRLATTTVMAFLCLGFCLAQDSSTGAFCRPESSPLSYVVEIIRGAPFDSVKDHVSVDAFLIKGRTREQLLDVLKGKDRASILNEDSTRLTSFDVNFNDEKDALYVILRTSDVLNANPRYHSVVLYKKPMVGWQIYLWHAGS
jgi:hypothetical protein